MEVRSSVGTALIGDKCEILAPDIDLVDVKKYGWQFVMSLPSELDAAHASW
jgi:hypothetical protein